MYDRYIILGESVCAPISI